MNKYNPEFFEPKSYEDARNIVLMYHEMSAEDRWESETNWTRDLLIAMRSLNENSVVLDWGTGVGRIAKMLIETFNCKVVGVDINKKMLDYAIQNVNSDKFSVMTYDEFLRTSPTAEYTHATATWVLQHSNTSQYDIALIQKALKDQGKMFVIDMLWKCIPKVVDGESPSATNFYDDKVNNKDELARWFIPTAMGTIPNTITVQSICDISWWGFLQKRTKREN